MRNLNILKGNEHFSFTVVENTNLMEALKDNGVYVPALCSGRGTCGKCCVKVVRGNLPVSNEDKRFFDEKKLESGLRLSCKAFVTEDLTISLDSDESQFDILTSFENLDEKINTGFSFVNVNSNDLKIKASETLASDFSLNNLPLSILSKISEKAIVDTNLDFKILKNNDLAVDLFYDDCMAYGVSIDIGTTTIALLLFDLVTSKQIASYSVINKQRVYGADVISRIVAARDGKLEELTKSVQNDIAEGIKALAKEASIDFCNIYKVVVAANTTMLHLLLGLQCSSLGVFPFKCTFTSLGKFRFYDVFKDFKDVVNKNCEVVILPSVSSYVGADITAGMVYLNKDKDLTTLLIDIGTNGEMAVFGGKLGEKIICTSTAAGPAFEGGNISCGIGSVPGAISKVWRKDGKFTYETINDKPAVGICGSGVMDLVACLVKDEIIDETGVLEDEYFDDGVNITDSIAFLQKDIRELQLAKAAIRAGIEILIKTANLNYDNIDKVYLAGGFGFRMSIESAVTIGLIPGELKEKVVSVGNSSLAGATTTLLNVDNEDLARNIVSSAEEINLSENRDFNDLYVTHMYF